MASSESKAGRPFKPVRSRSVAFDTQSAEDLGFDEIRERLSGLCKTESAQRRARDLAPSTHRPTVMEALDSTDELRRIRVEGHSFPTLVFEEIKGEIKL